MNKRIKELALQVGAGTPQSLYGRTDYIVMTEFELEKFAQLIIRECAKSANYWYQNHDKIHSDPMSYVLAHFGVEE